MKLLRLLSAALSAAVVLAGCTQAPATTTEVTGYDVSFTGAMIHHKQQAVTMAEMAPTHADSPAVKDLAADIATAQVADIEQLRAALPRWGFSSSEAADEETGEAEHADEHEHADERPSDEPAAEPAGQADEHADEPADEDEDEHADAPAVMLRVVIDNAMMAELESADGPAWDRLFLELMIAHHQGAIGMAEDAEQVTRHVRIREFTEQLITEESAEIVAFEKLLEDLNAETGAE